MAYNKYNSGDRNSRGSKYSPKNNERKSGSSERGYAGKSGSSERGYAGKSGSPERGYAGKSGSSERGYAGKSGSSEHGYAGKSSSSERGYAGKSGYAGRGTSAGYARKSSGDANTSLYNSNGKRLDRSLGRVKAEQEQVETVRHGRDVDSEAVEIRDDLIEGRNPVTEALEAGRSINRILIAKGLRDSSIGKIINLAKEKNIPVAETDKDLMDKMSVVGSHQGVIALASPKEYCTVDDILNISAEKGTKPFIVILDNLNDPHNFGAVIRCAECAGADGIIIPQRRSVAVTPVVAKVSAGAVEHMPIARVINIAQTIDDLKDKGLWIVGTDGSGTMSYKDCDYDMPTALVIGSEGSGMSRLVTEKCDFLVNIPMMGKVNSLNAAMASAVVMFEIVTQRLKK